MSLLEVDSLSQAYGGSRILREVSFTAEAGKVVVLLGRNGVGKSTLLRTLMGIHPALAGSVRLGGRTLDGLPPQRRAPPAARDRLRHQRAAPRRAARRP